MSTNCATTVGLAVIASYLFASDAWGMSASGETRAQAGQVSIIVILIGTLVALTALYFSLRYLSKSMMGANIESLVKAKEKDIEAASAQSSIESSQRFGLALAVIAFSVVVLLVFVVVLLVRTDYSENEYARVKDLLTVVLPVLGTWVGTVLAFYFARENFEAATSGTRALLGARGDERLQHIGVRVVMLSRARIKPLVIAQGKTSADYHLQDLDDIVVQGFSRIPILSHNDAVQHIVHQSVLYLFLAKHAAGQPANQVTLDTLLNHKDCAPIVKAIAFVAENANLADAKAAKDAVPHCQDIIVTRNGRPDEAVLGWITNVDVERAGRY